ncbi:MAG TPA: hypothetical protein VGN26_12255 [Armatimonadota bacterium]
MNLLRRGAKQHRPSDTGRSQADRACVAKANQVRRWLWLAADSGEVPRLVALEYDRRLQSVHSEEDYLALRDEIQALWQASRQGVRAA